MFEFLPGADAAQVKPATQQPLVEAVRERRAEREAVQTRKDQTTVWDGIGAAQVKGGIGFIDRFTTELGFDIDPEFRIPPDARKRWESQGLRPEQWELFGRAVSADHLSFLEHTAFQNQMADEDLAQFGLGGQILLGFTDPVATGLDLATGGLGYAAKAGRIANAVRSGTQGAAVSATLSAAQSAYDPELTLADGVQSAALSFAFAGALGARRGALYDGTVNPDAVKRLAGDDSLSAARVAGSSTADPTPGAMPLRNETDREAAFVDQALTKAHIAPAFGAVRRDLAARMGNAASPLVREAGRMLFRDGVGYTDRSIAVKESAGEFAKRHLASFDTEWRAGTNAAWAAYKARTGAHWWNVGERIRFNEEVGRAVRGEADVSPEAQQAARSVADTMQRVLQLARDSGLDGFDNVRANGNYLPRYFSARGFQRMFGDLGLHKDDVIAGLIQPAMRRAWQAAADDGEVIDDELLGAVARAWVDRAQRSFEGDGMDLLVRPLNADAVDEIARMLQEAGVSPTRAQTLIGGLEQRAYQSGKLDRARRRIDLDETFAATLRNEAGDEVEVSVADLLDNDIDAVMSRYLREMTGWSAMAAKVGVKSRGELDAWRRQVEADARKSGDRGVSRLLDIGERSVFGRSTEENPAGAASRYGRFLRNYNFSRVMNQVGFTLFAELGPAIAHGGLRNFIESTTVARDLIRRGADGTLVSEEARTMERLFAPGTDWMRNPPFLRIDDGALAPQTFNVLGGHHIDNAMSAANYVTSVASGMAPINTMLQRIAGRATMLRLLDLANAKALTPAEVARLRSWGLTEKAQGELFGHLRGKQRIEDIDPDALPFQTREHMAAFLFRVTRHQVMEGDASDSIELMHGVTGRLLLQFRSFMVNSYTRHFLNSVHHYDDWRTYAMVTLSAGFAGMGWAARTYVNTVGNPEQREKQLTMANFYKNAVAQSSWATAIPAITDAVWSDILRNDPVFANNRSTGLENGVMGIPTLDLFNRAYGSLGMAGAAINNDQAITEKQMRDFWKIWWFNNLTGVRNIADEVARQFPDRADGTDRD